MDLVGSWSLPTAVSVDETCILGVSQEGEKKSYPLLLKVSFKVAQVLAVHFWMIKMYMENIFNAIYHKCCFACLWMHQCKFGFQCFHAAFHTLLNMRCGSNVNVFFLSHFSVLFLLSYIAILKDTYRWENKKNICDFLCVKERSYDCRQLVWSSPDQKNHAN